MKVKDLYKQWFLIIPSIFFFFYWFFSLYYNKPLVWDETVSLINFVLVDLTTTVTHYPDVNNHVFFNLLNNFYLKAVGISDLYVAMDHIPLIRVFPLVITLVTMTYMLLLAKRNFNKAVLLMSAIIMVTTMPYLNFALQLRGYSLSAMFLIISVFHFWEFEKSRNYLHGIIAMISTTALLYTIPSNVFFVLSIGFIYGLKWLDASISERKNGNKGLASFTGNTYFLILLFIALASAFAYLCYLPIVDDIVNERHLQQMKGQSFYEYNIKDLVPNVLYAFLSFKFLFIFPVLISMWYLLRKLRLKLWSDQSVYRVIFLILLLVLPFVISFIRGDKTPQRSMVPLASVFSLLTAISIYVVLKEIKWARKNMYVVVLVVIAYSLISYKFCRDHVNTVLHKAMLDGEKINSMLYNFYQSDEYDLHKLDELIAEVKLNAYPIVMAKEIDRVSEGEYLHKHDLTYYATVWCKPAQAENQAGFNYQVLLEISQGKGQKPAYNRIAFPPQIEAKSGRLVPLVSYLIQGNIIDQKEPNFYVLTYDARWFEHTMKTDMKQFKYKRLDKRLSYHNIYFVSKR